MEKMEQVPQGEVFQHNTALVQALTPQSTQLDVISEIPC